MYYQWFPCKICNRKHCQLLRKNYPFLLTEPIYIYIYVCVCVCVWKIIFSQHKVFWYFDIFMTVTVNIHRKFSIFTNNKYYFFVPVFSRKDSFPFIFSYFNKHWKRQIEILFEKYSGHSHNIKIRYVYMFVFVCVCERVERSIFDYEK